MRPTAWAALLAVLSTTAVNLIGASPVMADPECRTSIIGPDALPDDQPIQPPGTGNNPVLWKPFGLYQSRWSVLGVDPAAGTDYDLEIRDCPVHDPLATSLLGGSAVDFVALDGSQNWGVPAGQELNLYATVNRWGQDSGAFNIGYSTGGPDLVVGSPETLLMRGMPAAVRDLYVAPGTTATVVLTVLTGDGDLALVDSNPGDQATWARSRAQAIQHSLNPGTRQDRLTISVPADARGRTFGVVIVNNAPLGQYTVERS